MAVFSMKSMSGSGESIVHGALTPTEALSYAMSVPAGPTTISGMDSMEVLDQNLEILHSFRPLDENTMATSAVNNISSSPPLSCQLDSVDLV
jgi:uncharacterized protein